MAIKVDAAAKAAASREMADANRGLARLVLTERNLADVTGGGESSRTSDACQALLRHLDGVIAEFDDDAKEWDAVVKADAAGAVR